MVYEIVFSKNFGRSLRKIVRNNPNLKAKIRKQVEMLSLDPGHSSLRIHKLSGTNNWSVSVTDDMRIIFTIDGKTLLCNRIGSHDEVY